MARSKFGLTLNCHNFIKIKPIFKLYVILIMVGTLYSFCIQIDAKDPHFIFRKLQICNIKFQLFIKFIYNN